MKYLGVDIGSSSIKSAVLDLDKNAICVLPKVPSPARSPHPNERFFQVPAKEYLTLIKRMIEESAEAYGDLAGVLLSTQMHGFVLEDVYVSWQDTRCLDSHQNGKSFLEVLKEIIPAERMRECGVPLKPSLGLCNLYAKLTRECRTGEGLELFTLGSYLIAQLTGRNVCHASNAGPLGFYNVYSRSWDRELLAICGMADLKLPEIAEHDFVPCGIYRTGRGEIPIFPDYGDQQISILGSGARDKEAIINIATAGQVSSFCSTPKAGDYEIRPYFDGSYLQVISNMPAGRDLDVLSNFIRNILEQMTGEPWPLKKVQQRMDSSFQPADPNYLEVATSFYPGRQDSGGSIRGIKPENLTLNQLLSAAYRNMADTYWQNICHLQDPEQVEAVVCAGGVSWKTPYLIEEVQKRSGRKCRLSCCPDEALYGLFQVAQHCTGISGSPSKNTFPKMMYHT